MPSTTRAFEALPESVRERFFRADSACYDQDLLSYLRHERIGFAISADMSESLREQVAKVPDSSWKTLDEGREWAEVFFLPTTALHEPEDIPADRYVAIRAKPRQLTLWEKEGYRYWAVVTNLPWKGERVLAWHREKAGTIEHVHHVTKNELGLGLMPCSRFGADAAWCRLNLIAYNLLSILKRVALPKSLKNARPKRLRYEIFQLAGIVIRHARCTVVRLGMACERIATLISARHQLAALPYCLSP